MSLKWAGAEKAYAECTDFRNGAGIGFELARQYALDGWQVHATVRDLSRSDKLRALGSEVTVHELEVTDKASMDALARTLHSVALDVVIANAGVAGPRGMTIETIDRESWTETLAVNTIAPAAMAGAFKRNLDKGKQKKLIAISSRLGSISQNDSGGLYPYRSAKAALNAVWKSLSIDLAEAGYICAVLHPGWVRTDMGGTGADIDAEESATGLRKVIDGLTKAQTGQLLDYQGQVIPW